MGTRHRAAIGVTEQSDALVIVVSEETGRISASRNGRIARVDGSRLRSLLSDYYSTLQ
jgi:diadenylate cyclase